MPSGSPHNTAKLISLNQRQLVTVLTHSTQVDTCRNIADMTAALHKSSTAEDFFALQRDLYPMLLGLEKRYAECARAAKGLASGKSADEVEPLPAGRDQDSQEDWQLEAYIHARLGRQFRSLGDGLAWQAFGYDRRPVIALSRNQGAGLMYGKAGLPYETSHVDRFYAETGQFALLNDITNCIRISDVTKFHNDGRTRLAEIKATGRKRSKQTQRAQRAVDALNDGSRLPGDLDAALMRLTTTYKTDLHQLAELIQTAGSRGCAGTGATPGRAVVVTDVPRLHETYEDPHAARTLMESAHAAATKQAGMTTDGQHIYGTSLDSASRSPVTVPFAIYPIPADDAARLICDFTKFDTTLSVESLADKFVEHGFEVSIDLPAADSAPHGDDPVMRISKQRKSGEHGTLTIHMSSFGQLLYELVDPATWVAAVRETFEGLTPTSSPHPSVVLTDESATWA